METFWFFRLRFRRAYDSAYDSDFRFSLGHKLSYDSDYDSDSDSVASENQPLEDNEQMASEFSSHFTSIADQLRSLLPQTNLDISKLIHFVDSRKDAGITFSIPSITESKVINCLMNLSSNKAS